MIPSHPHTGRGCWELLLHRGELCREGRSPALPLHPHPAHLHPPAHGRHPEPGREAGAGVCRSGQPPAPRLLDGQRAAPHWYLGRGGGCDPGATLAPPFRIPGVPARLAVRGCNQLVANHPFLGVCTPQMARRGTADGASCGGRQPQPRTAAPTSATPRTAPGPSGPPSSSLSEVGAGRETPAFLVPGQPTSLPPLSLSQRHRSYRGMPASTRWSTPEVMPSSTATPGVTLSPSSAGARTGCRWWPVGACTSCRMAPWPSVLWG